MGADVMRFIPNGANISDIGSSVLGVVGRDEPCPALLKTLSNIEDARFVDCGELGPEKLCTDWADMNERSDMYDHRLMFCPEPPPGKVAAVCDNIAAVLEGVENEWRGVLMPELGVNDPYRFFFGRRTRGVFGVLGA